MLLRPPQFRPVRAAAATQDGKLVELGVAVHGAGKIKFPAEFDGRRRVEGLEIARLEAPEPKTGQEGRSGPRGNQSRTVEPASSRMLNNRPKTSQSPS